MKTRPSATETPESPLAESLKRQLTCGALVFQSSVIAPSPAKPLAVGPRQAGQK
jgi:hypothetical protein